LAKNSLFVKPVLCERKDHVQGAILTFKMAEAKVADVWAESAKKEMPDVHAAAHGQKNDENRTHRAVEWHGAKDVRVNMNRPKPNVTDPQDVILRVTSTNICGSDLHLYLGYMPAMKSGDVLGHEFMGIVEEAGPEVKHVKKGDRVVACFDIGCGCCWFCEHELFSSCDRSNPSAAQEKLYGHRTAGLHGFGHLTGGWDGGQAEYARVPFADTNLLKVPDNLSDEQVVFLSDILCTAWHANELGSVGKGDVVAIWGAGPVGILAAHCAQVRGAKRVILIDNQAYRLKHAAAKLPGLETINFGERNVLEAIKELAPNGPDVGIEAVGFHYTTSMLSKAQMLVGLETDPSDMLNEMIYAVRKGGRLSVVGVYAGKTNGLAIGAFMEKGMSMAAGQTPCQKYWEHLLKMIDAGEIDPTIVITHRMPLDQAPHAYKIFNDKTEGCIKVILKPGLDKPIVTAPEA
jgi:threonine dehydrogenase-like Zn-dependent dehydrogenase